MPEDNPPAGLPALEERLAALEAQVALLEARLPLLEAWGQQVANTLARDVEAVREASRRDQWKRTLRR